VDLSFGRIQADDAFLGAMATVQHALDEAFMEALDSAPHDLLPALAVRLWRRGQREMWMAVQARALGTLHGGARAMLLRDLARALPEEAGLPVWQDALRGVFQSLEHKRRHHVHSVSEVRAHLIELELLGRLRPNAPLERALLLEQAFLQVALGALPEAEGLLQGVADHRLGLLGLLRGDPRWLPDRPLANGLVALMQDRLVEAREQLAQAPPTPLARDLRARVEALLGDWRTAEALNQQALEASRGLGYVLRYAFQSALRSRRLGHPLPSGGSLSEQLEIDRVERGIALWSRGDAPVMAHLQQILDHPGNGAEAVRSAIVQLGAAQPFTRLVGWTVADRRLGQGELRPEAWSLILQVELTALWSPEGFWP
jgi:hypothetical protein